jgi:predicted O-linked N-acetylglucosamine transferase (SPINDLY family)
MLAQGRKLGLPGSAVDALATRLGLAADDIATAPAPAELERIRQLYNEARFSELESAARSLVARFPAAGSGWKLLGLAQHGLGMPEQAEASMQKAVNLLPGDWQIHFILGNFCLIGNRLSAAEGHFHRCVQINPDHADAYCKLGVVHRKQANDAEAERCYLKALELVPNLAEAFFNLGNLRGDQSRLTEAETCYRSALALDPGFAPAHNNLGNVLLAQTRYEDAEASFRIALTLSPYFLDALVNLGNALTRQDKLSEAETAYQSALRLCPDLGSALGGLGNVLTLSGRVPEAENCYRQMLQNTRVHAEAPSMETRDRQQDCKDEIAACCCLAYTLMIQGRAAEADGYYRQARRIGMIPIEHDIQACLLLPPIYESRDDITGWRKRFGEGLEQLGTATEKLDPGYLHMPSFYLAYQNQNNCQLMTALNSVLRKRVSEAHPVANRVESWTPPESNHRRIRVGFLSEFFRDGHTIGKLYEGLIGGLDRDRFDVFVIEPGRRPRNAASQRTDRVEENCIELPEDLDSQFEILAKAKLDVLFFADIGMSAFSYFLAGRRTAPVQAVGWGHPDTTGIDTIDYYVSAASIEPENAQQNYTERLVRLLRLPCHYQTPPAPGKVPTRNELGLPESGTLYGCPQSLFKFHPDFDGVLAAIAEGDAGGHIVLLESAQAAWVAQLRARWAKTYPILKARVLFLPRQPLQKFMALLAHMDVLLDPVHFGSGNTLYEAMVYGTPVVTWPGNFMRGRIVSGAYRQMAVADAPVVAHIEEYAAMALALGRDPQRRRLIREASVEAARRELYEDRLAVREFECFLDTAVTAAGRGEILPTGWTPGIPAALTE